MGIDLGHCNAAVTDRAAPFAGEFSRWLVARPRGGSTFLFRFPIGTRAVHPVGTNTDHDSLSLCNTVVDACNCWFGIGRYLRNLCEMNIRVAQNMSNYG